MNKKDQETTPVSNLQFPVVGIGASAGGLEAIKVFIKAIPAESGMAFVFGQHLSATHESALPEILQPHSKIPVLEITDNINLEKDHFYTIPSNKVLVTVDGSLKLADKKDKGKTIDVFFSSLAVVYQSYSVGIVLSGTLTDGTLGLQIIKTYGGITMAQDAKTATFDDMPKSAIKAGVVDFILPPDKMVQKLIQLNQPFHQDYTLTEISKNLPQKDEEVFKQLITLLRVRRGVDFTYYKDNTLKRRIVRRMALNKIEKPDEYLSFVRENKSEQDALYNDMLISVSSFFRDPASFELLCNTIFPTLIKQKADNNVLRVWVAGCATGEEAYSMAMCLLEYLGDKATAIKIRIFATDISETALAKARIGIYRQTELEGLSASRLQQFFSKLDGSYQVNKSIRDLCVFAQHNLLKDPPFSQMDLVSCRNVLIYLEPVLQKRALSTFHYSLNEKGFLMLGKAESIGSSTDLFKPYNSHEKIYLRVGPRGRFMNVTSIRGEQAMSERDQDSHTGKDKSIYSLADETLLSKYTPSGVLINENYDIIQFRGITGTWLTPSPGKASLSVLKMAREGLAFELRNLLTLAKKANAPARKEGIFFKAGNQQQYVNIEVVPISEANGLYYLVLFENSVVPTDHLEVNKTGTLTQKEQKEDPRDLHIRQLEKELLQIREDMRTVTEMQETANEELLSTNQELLSSSEELQSLNEELETSKEELQSTNEEITIVNKELIDRNEQLNISRNYAEAIVNTVRDPLIIMDNDLIVLRATEGFYTKFKVTEEDTEGKYFYELGNKQWDIPTLRKHLDEVMAEKKSFKDFEVRHKFPSIGPKVMLLNARQIKSISGEDLILLSMEDITYKRKVEEGLAEVENLLEEYTERLRFATLAGGLGTFDYNILTKELIPDRRCNELFGIQPGEYVDIEVFINLISSEDKEIIKKIFNKTSKGESNGVYDLEILIKDHKDHKAKWLKTKGKTYFDENGVPNHISGIVMDITSRKNAEEAMKDLLKKKDEFISITSHELKTPIATIRASLQLAEREISKKEEMKTVYPLVKKANDNLNKLTHLLTDLLDATKIQSGKLRLNKTHFNLKEMIEDCCDQMRSIFTTHQITLYGDMDIIIFADRPRIEQVLINLLSNAIKYSPHRDKVILKVTQQQEQIKIEVTDFGIGIPKDQIPLVFSRFYRVEENSVQFSGLGLGMYISSEIVNRHKGEIGIESELDKGSTFWFTLPVDKNQDGA